MSTNIIIKNDPKIEFQLHENGFDLFDAQSERNNGFYSYIDLQSINLKSPWYPRVAKWLRVITWIFNGVPLFPDGKTCKKAALTFQHKKTKHGIWLTDTSMANKAKSLKKLLETKVKEKRM